MTPCGETSRSGRVAAPLRHDPADVVEARRSVTASPCLEYISPGNYYVFRGNYRWRTLGLAALAPIAWGSGYYVTETFLPPDRPLFGAMVRALPFGLLLLAFRPELPQGIWWWRALVLGTLNIGAFFVLIFIAAYRLPGGTAATLTATAPIMVMLVAWGLIGERPRAASLVGAAVGAAGVALLVLRADFAVDPIGVAASFGAVAMSSVGFVLVKRWKPPVDLLTFTAWQLVAGGLVLLPVALIVEGAPPALERERDRRLPLPRPRRHARRVRRLVPRPAPAARRRGVAGRPAQPGLRHDHRRRPRGRVVRRQPGARPAAGARRHPGRPARP